MCTPLHRGVSTASCSSVVENTPEIVLGKRKKKTLRNVRWHIPPTIVSRFCPLRDTYNNIIPTRAVEWFLHRCDFGQTLIPNAYNIVI